MLTGKVIRLMRIARGMTQAELGQTVGRDQSIISNIEQDLVRPTEETERKIKEVLRFEEARDLLRALGEQ